MDIPEWLKKESAEKNSYWFRTSMGLESMVADEISENLQPEQLFQSHRNVFAAINPKGREVEELLLQIRTADDVYRYLGCCTGVDRTRDSTENLVAYFRKSMIPLLSTYSSGTFLRITVSFVGKRNFNRYFVEHKLNALVDDLTPLTPLNNEERTGKQEGELRLRCHIENETAFWGMGLTDSPLHRRAWRSIKYTGQLHTPIAAAMVRALPAEKAQVIIDPFCGSGTIVIQSALCYRKHHHFGYDIDRAAVEIARKSADLAQVDVVFKMQDSLGDNAPDQPYLLISNPPWDEKHEIDLTKKHDFMRQLIRLVEHSVGAVLLLPEGMVEELEKKSDLAIERLVQTRIRGKLAWIIRC